MWANLEINLEDPRSQKLLASLRRLLKPVLRYEIFDFHSRRRQVGVYPEANRGGGQAG
jgi:hypothetical protein